MYGGVFTTRYQSLIDFKVPEFDNDKVVTWACNVDDKTPQENAQYDMIIGMDLMTEIGIVIDCEDKVIKWEGQEIPMKENHLLSLQEVLEMMYFAAGEPQGVLEAEDRHAKILDADYSKGNMDEYVHELSYLTRFHQ